MNTVQVTDELQTYLDSLLAHRDPVLARMEEEAHRENIPIVDGHEGAFLSLLVRIANAKRVLEQDAVRGLEKLNARFDACFIDLLNSFPSEEVTRKVFDLCMQRLDGGGLLIADNALRQGLVVKPTNQQSRNVAFYNQLVAKDARLESVVVPIRDGISVARVKD